MEFCEYGDLTSSIKTLDPVRRKAWIGQLALGLQHMHSLRVIHRDIKTVRWFIVVAVHTFYNCCVACSAVQQDNILIAATRGRKSIKYIDFGFAIQVPDHLPHRYGRAGTPGYMAPEVDSKQRYSCNADVWSLGVVFFQVGIAQPASKLLSNKFIQEHAFLPTDVYWGACNRA